MKKKITTWALIIIGIIILGLIITNPSTTKYTAYLKSMGYQLDSRIVQIHSATNGLPAEDYECKPFWGKKNSFLILSSYEYQNDSVSIEPEKVINNSITPEEKEELKAYNAGRMPKYYHITKNHLGFLSRFIQTKATVEEFKKN